MKLKNFKIVPFILACAALLALSGCGSTGTPSDGGLTGTNPVVPVPDATTSTVTVSPDSVVANGIEISIVTVTVNDASSNPIIDATVTLVQTGTSTISAVTNVGDGTYTFNVNSTDVETVTYTATAGSVEITQTTDVTFTAPPLTEAECLFDAGGYVAIDVNGRTWLDRNLGASEVADATLSNSPSYGNLYQWGRAAEGHEDRNSALTQGVHADTIVPDTNISWNGMFITVGQTGMNLDWTEGNVDQDGSQRSTLWSSPSGSANLNQVCPCGYVVPTSSDFMDLNTPTLIAELNLPYVGYREPDGNLRGEGIYGDYWTSETSLLPTNANSIYVNNGIVTQTELDRIEGHGIRCIKPL